MNNVIICLDIYLGLLEELAHFKMRLFFVSVLTILVKNGIFNSGDGNSARHRGAFPGRLPSQQPPSPVIKNY